MQDIKITIANAKRSNGNEYRKGFWGSVQRFGLKPMAAAGACFSTKPKIIFITSCTSAVIKGVISLGMMMRCNILSDNQCTCGEMISFSRQHRMLK